MPEKTPQGRAKFAEKVYVITGATSGMGRATALALGAEGASTVISGRDETRGQQLVSEVTKAGGAAVFHPGDVANPSTNESLVAAAKTSFGRLDGLVLNAGMLGLGSITEASPELWRQTFEVNVHSAYYLLHAAIPAMQAVGGGAVVLNASIAATKSFPNHPAYCSSKAALVALGRQAALDYAPDVRVNSICPGPVDTPLIWDSAKAFEDPDSAVRAAGEATLIGRLGQPEDFAKLALFLLSDDSSWITGAAFTLDGGITVS